MTTAAPQTLAPSHRADLIGFAYSSRATVPFSDEDLAILLASCRGRNEEQAISGLLLYREGRFLQYLEGPGEAVADCVGRISVDGRHQEFTALMAEPLDARLFPSWSMAYRPTRELEGEKPGLRTTFDDLEGEPGVAGTLAALRELSSWFRQPAK